MPILGSQLSYRDMKRLSDNPLYTCGKCGGRLNLAWDGGQYILRCGNDITHDTLNHYSEKSQAQIEGEKIFRRLNNMDTMALTTMSEAKMIQRIDMAKFPQDLNPAEKKVLALVARSYGLDPLMGELMLYYGKPFVGIDGRRRKAQETNELDGVETRPATLEERTAWQVEEGDYFFHADIYKKGCAHPFEGWGRVTKEEIDRAIKSAKSHNKDPWHMPIIKDPQGLAEKRSEAKGMRKAFHIPLPSIEDIDGDEVVEAEAGLESEPVPGFESTNKIDMTWLRENLKLSKWGGQDLRNYFETELMVDASGTITDIVERLSAEQQTTFVAEVQRRLIYGPA